MWTKEKNSLAHIRRFLEYLGNPDKEVPVIHVAGTNGKGSVCAYLTQGLFAAGYRVGTFLSPHLVKIQERFLLNGQMAEEGLFEESFRKVKEAADVLVKQGLRHPTFFEFLFYMGAVYFARQKVDFWVVETGLGGRLDTTNVIEHPLISIITSISLDHTNYLGETIREIAEEKAGIIKKGIPVIFDANDEEAAQVIRQRAIEQGSPFFPISRQDFHLLKATGSIPYVMELKKEKTRMVLPFPAPYQADNGALAWKAFTVLMENGRIEKKREPLLMKGMESTVWPGRMEEICPGVFLDGAHNPAGMEAFTMAASAIAKRQPQGRILVLFAVVSDKNYQSMISCLWNQLHPDLTAVVSLHSERGLKAEQLKSLFLREMDCQVEGFEEVKAAFEFLLDEKGSQDFLFCVGSLYLIGEIKAELERRYHD